MKQRSSRLSWLDFKVGFRMLRRFPGITLVGALAISVAIALGALYFEAIDKFLNPRLPVEDADRIVSVRMWDARVSNPETRLLHDYAVWRDQVRTLDLVGAATAFTRNLETADGVIEPVRGAEVTANAFTLMGTAPLLGRTLNDRDELPGEPPVLVIGERLWRTRFDSDSDVIGHTARIGTTTATIVGVMPESFRFPRSELAWLPLRFDEAGLAPRAGQPVAIFGRLAEGASMDAARAELDAIQARFAATDPETYTDLRPRVTRYAKPGTEGPQAMIIRTVMVVVNTIFIAFLIVVCTTVATLVFARTAARSWELTVRGALGASRSRMILQLFAEALVLTGVAAGIGLLLAKLALSYGLTLLTNQESLPFWIDDGISWRTVLYAGVLALLGAAIIGVLPALRATRLNVQDALRSGGNAGASMRFGGFWTAVIVAQVAITVALLPLAGAGVFESNRFMQRAEGIGAEHYLSATVDVDREDWSMDSTAFVTRSMLSLRELQQRLAAEPGVEHVAFADRLPVEDQFKYGIEVDSTGGLSVRGQQTSTLVRVSDGFFDAFGTSIVNGRDFVPLDFEGDDVMIVNESFVRYILGGRNALGQRIRIVDGEDSRVTGERWYEIVGVVRDFGWQLPRPHEQSAMYLPHAPRAGDAGSLVIRAQDPESFGPRLRTVAASVDPSIRVTDVQPLARIGGGEATINWALTGVAWLLGAIVLLLSATGIHALMSYTVARRTREIGILAALGARPSRIVRSVFSRAFLQIGAGLLVGTMIAALIGGLDTRLSVLLLLAANAIMLTVGLAACALPLRRALRIEPTQALRAEA